MLGIFGIYLVFGTISIPEILAAAPHMAGSTIGFLGHRVDTMTLLCLLLFVGAMRQVGAAWPPHLAARCDGGPDPGVGADPRRDDGDRGRVHGVPPVADVRDQSVFAQHVVMTVGAATCFFAATVGLVQTDIKRVIAYSTCSQLGYMFFAAGVGAYNGAAMFHLFTHAFFKALLFLGAGSVIHAMHHEQDMRYYGGLRKQHPDHLLGDDGGHAGDHRASAFRRCSAIRWRFGFAGFHSKDAIIEASWAAGQQGASVVGMLVALLTSFYSWRLMFLTFWGKPRWDAVRAYPARAARRARP